MTNYIFAFGITGMRILKSLIPMIISDDRNYTSFVPVIINNDFGTLATCHMSQVMKSLDSYEQFHDFCMSDGPYDGFFVNQIKDICNEFGHCHWKFKLLGLPEYHSIYDLIGCPNLHAPNNHATKKLLESLCSQSYVFDYHVGINVPQTARIIYGCEDINSNPTFLNLINNISPADNVIFAGSTFEAVSSSGIISFLNAYYKNPIIQHLNIRTSVVLLEPYYNLDFIHCPYSLEERTQSFFNYYESSGLKGLVTETHTIKSNYRIHCDNLSYEKTYESELKAAVTVRCIMNGIPVNTNTLNWNDACLFDNLKSRWELHSLLHNLIKLAILVYYFTEHRDYEHLQRLSIFRPFEDEWQLHDGFIAELKKICNDTKLWIEELKDNQGIPMRAFNFSALQLENFVFGVHIEAPQGLQVLFRRNLMKRMENTIISTIKAESAIVNNPADAAKFRRILMKSLSVASDEIATIIENS